AEQPALPVRRQNSPLSPSDSRPIAGEGSGGEGSHAPPQVCRATGHFHTAYCRCLPPLPPATAYCHCLLPLPTAAASRSPDYNRLEMQVAGLALGGRPRRRRPGLRGANYCPISSRVLCQDFVEATPVMPALFMRHTTARVAASQELALEIRAI